MNKKGFLGKMIDCTVIINFIIFNNQLIRYHEYMILFLYSLYILTTYDTHY
jgi:hypothetical protein